MSHEQKPGKLRLVNTGKTPHRRAGESKSADDIVAASREVATSGTRRGPAMLLAGLFVLACAAGGGAGAWFHLADALPQ